VTSDIWSRLVRLPLHMELTDGQVGDIVAACREYLSR